MTPQCTQWTILTYMFQWRGSLVEHLTGIKGLLVRDSLELLCCVIEKDLYTLLGSQSRKTGKCANVTEKLLTGM